MGLNVEYAVKYMFKDQQWKKKFLVGWVFMLGMVVLNILSNFANFFSDLKYEQLKPYLHLLPILLIVFSILFLISFVLGLFSSGYFAKNINLRIFKPESELLEWNNWKDIFLVGFKFNIAYLVYFIIFFLILLIFHIIFFTLTSLLSPAGIAKITVLMGLILGVILSLILIIILVFYLAAATLAFCTDLKFASFFNFSLIKKFITKKFFDYFIYLLLLFAVSTLVSIVNSILMITIVGILLMPFTLFYQFLVQNELAAQFVRNTLDLPVNQE